MKTRRVRRPKTVSYTLIPQGSDVGTPMYDLLYRIVADHHEDLDRTQVRIALAWATSWKADVDGRLMLGKCKKATDLDRELAPYDFVILLNRDFWQNPRVTDVQRRALLDHELMHAAVVYDDQGDLKTDERGRQVYRIRKHDLEEFSDIASRYGCWKRDIESFAQALRRAEVKVGGAWVGFSSLHETLREIGVEVALEVIAAWPDRERREVMTWALLRQAAGEQVNVGLSPSMPACLVAAVRPPADQPAQ
jgi:hypothetical protein